MLDVSQVSHGKPNDCECPVCGISVLAHQGEAPDCYFAHATEPQSDSDNSVCDHAMFVSIRHMAHQLLGKIDTIRVPFAPGETDLQHRNIKIDDLQVDVDFHGVPVDAVVMMQGAPLVLYVTHPSRQVPSELYDLEGDRVGALRISLEALPRYYDLPLIKQEGQWLNRDALKSWLKFGVESKSWIYHPRQKH